MSTGETRRSMIRITVNGNRQSFDSELTVSDLLEQLGAPKGAVAVEVNQAIIPRSAHELHRLEDGDVIEVVTFVGGG